METKLSGIIAHIPLYPVLFALYAVFYFYGQNVARILIVEAMVVSFIALVVTLLIWVVAWLIVRNRHRAAAISALWVTTIFSFGHLMNLIMPQRFGLDPSQMIPILVVVTIALSALIARRKTQISGMATLFLNVMALTLILMPAFRIATFYVSRLTTPQAESDFVGLANVPRAFVPNSAQHPDVYYLILDGYSSNTHLMRGWGYDNSTFTDALEARGFVVAYDSNANYAITVVSIASSLNMRYVVPEERQPTLEGRQAYLYSLIADNAVATQFQTLGYKYVHVMSGFGHFSRTADENIDVYPDGVRHYTRGDTPPACHSRNNCNPIPFVRIFLESTLLLPLLQTSAGESMMSSLEQTPDVSSERPLHFDSARRALAIWDEVESVAAMPEATFTFAHILKPHIPIVFDSSGNVVRGIEQGDEAAFFDQLQFINDRTLAMVDAILEQSSVPPIIIIQGDHGSELGVGMAGNRRVLFGILNAIRFPGAGSSVDPDLTPVNTFRLLFNTYFDGQYALLEDHHYWVTGGYSDPFAMQEVNPQDVTDHPESYSP